MPIKRHTTEIFIQRSKRIHPDKFTYNNTVYVNSTTPTILTCIIHGDFTTRPNNHINHKSGCPICSGRTRKTLAMFIEDVKRVHNDKFLFDKTEYINDNTKVTITCKHHGDFVSIPTNILQGSGCPQCALEQASIRYRKSLDTFIAQAHAVHDDKYDYSLVEYKNSRTKVPINCPIHGLFYQTPGSHLHDRCGCPKCKSSKGEIQIRNWLTTHKFVFIEQYSFPECRDRKILKFDFYLPIDHVLIEYNGIQHYKYIHAFHKDKDHDSFDRSKGRDGIKRAYAKNMGLRLLTIPYNTSVEKLLTDELKSPI